MRKIFGKIYKIQIERKIYFTYFTVRCIYSHFFFTDCLVKSQPFFMSFLRPESGKNQQLLFHEYFL